MFAKICAGACLVSLAGAPAMADEVFEYENDAQDGNSWSDGFRYFNNDFPGDGYDFIGVSMTSPGDAFEDQAIFNFNQSGWDSPYFGETSTMAYASGDVVQDMRFRIKFEGFSNNSLRFDIYFFRNDNLVRALDVNWNGNSRRWSDTRISDPALGRNDFLAAVVPLPSSAGLAGLGLMALSVRRRRA